MKSKQQSKIQEQTSEVLKLIKKIENAEKLSSIVEDVQRKNEKLQISPSSQTGIVFSLRW